jgi:hypothetical protein
VNADGYQSYVVRIRRRDASAESGTAVRADIEDLLDGGRVCLQGEPARSIASQLESLLRGQGGSATTDEPLRETT